MTTNYSEKLNAYQKLITKSQVPEVISNEIKIGCPWGKAPCGRDKKSKETWGCEDCPAFDKEMFKKIMDADAEEEARREASMKEWRDSFIPKNIFGSVDDI